MTKAEIAARISQYYDTLRTMETERWVAEYAPNGTIEDPVGGPVVAGHERLTSFFNKVVKKSMKLLDLKPELIIIAPPEAVVRWTTRAVTQAGAEAYFNGISLFKFSEDGKVLQMRAFWDADELTRQTKP